MAIGERIKHFRKLSGMTQKELGREVGFDDKTADIRIAQYESGTRTPKDELTNAIADAVGVSPDALNVPDIDSDTGLIHTLFALEDICGLTVETSDGRPVLRFSEPSLELSDMIFAWYNNKSKLEAGEITKEEYDRWRYNYPGHERQKPVPVIKKKPAAAQRSAASVSAQPAAPTKTSGVPTKSVDDILAQLRANLDILKSGQLIDDDDDE